MTADELRARRKAAGLTLRETAERLAVALRTVQGWEGGERKISPAMAKLIEAEIKPDANPS